MTSPLDLLHRPVPSDLAARTFGVSPTLFDGIAAARLTLLTAFRLALRAGRADLAASRARKRAAQIVAARQHPRMHVPADAAAAAVACLRDAIAQEFDALAKAYRQDDPLAARLAETAAGAIRIVAADHLRRIGAGEDRHRGAATGC